MAGVQFTGATRDSRTIRTGETSCCSTSIFTAITGAASGQVTRPAGPGSWPSCCSRAVSRQKRHAPTNVTLKLKSREHGRMRMKALAVFPGKPNSLHLAELDKPSLAEVSDGRGVLVRVLRV